ncbi:hypothetical protein Hdeb2414_s0016g00485611 [Helianthus debilis subsp. tardiflorus]
MILSSFCLHCTHTTQKLERDRVREKCDGEGACPLPPTGHSAYLLSASSTRCNRERKFEREKERLVLEIEPERLLVAIVGMPTVMVVAG